MANWRDPDQTERDVAFFLGSVRVLGRWAVVSRVQAGDWCLRGGVQGAG